MAKNKVTPNEAAFNDYAACLKHLTLTLIILWSTWVPNTPGFAPCKKKNPAQVDGRFKSACPAATQAKTGVAKIAPDLTNEQIDDIDILKSTWTDGVIATNTTINRNGLNVSTPQLEKIGNGGLSGKPLTNRNWSHSIFTKRSWLRFPIIGVEALCLPMMLLKNKIWRQLGSRFMPGFIYEDQGLVESNKRNPSNAAAISLSSHSISYFVCPSAFGGIFKWQRTRYKKQQLENPRRRRRANKSKSKFSFEFSKTRFYLASDFLLLMVHFLLCFVSVIPVYGQKADQRGGSLGSANLKSWKLALAWRGLLHQNISFTVGWGIWHSLSHHLVFDRVLKWLSNASCFPFSVLFFTFSGLWLSASC